jgi:hypothetical protein
VTAVNKTNKIKIETHRGKKTQLLENIPVLPSSIKIDPKSTPFGFLADIDPMHEKRTKTPTTFLSR